MVNLRQKKVLLKWNIILISALKEIHSLDASVDSENKKKMNTYDVTHKTSKMLNNLYINALNVKKGRLILLYKKKSKTKNIG